MEESAILKLIAVASKNINGIDCWFLIQRIPKALKAFLWIGFYFHQVVFVDVNHPLKSLYLDNKQKEVDEQQRKEIAFITN